MPKLTYTYGQVKIESPYNAAFVDELKTTIPSRFRVYDPHSKSWTAFRPYVTVARDMVKRYWQFLEEVNIGAYDAEQERDASEEQARQAESQRVRDRQEQRDREGRERRERARQQAESPYEGKTETRFDFINGRVQRRRYARGQWGPWEDVGSEQDRQRAGSGRADDFFRSSSLNGSDDYATLFVLSTAPKEVIAAAYKALALLYHPDRPSTSLTKDQQLAKMEALNVAKDRIYKAKGWS